MQLSTSRFYDRAATSFGRLTARAETLQTQISTGVRLQAPSDDALAYRRLAGLATTGANAKVYDANLSLAAGVLKQADTALSAIGDQLQKATELALKASNDTLSTNDRRAIGVELAGIVETLAGLANAADPRGQPLFGGTDGGAAVVKGAAGYTLAGTLPSTIPIGDGQSVQATESAARVFGITGKNGATDALTLIADLAAALAGGAATGDVARAAVDDLNLAGEQAAAIQASLGARAARVEIVQAQLVEAGIDREEARATLEDADRVAAATELQKTMTILQASQASFAKLSQLSLFDYLR
jgi:flagellar hook-associated protein 3 FlgL